MKNKETPYDFWNHGIHPILGFRWQKQPMQEPAKLRNKNEYVIEDDYNPNED